MAKTPRRELRLLLRQLGVSKAAPFMGLISQALQNKWSVERFVMEVRVSRPFNRLFPGIPDNMMPADYLATKQEFRLTMDYYGIKASRGHFRALFEGRVSPVEFEQRGMIFRAVQESEEERAYFQSLLPKDLQRRLTRQGWFNVLARRDRELLDIYEATRLGLGVPSLRPSAAKAIARTLGAPTELFDVGKIVAQVRAVKDFVGPELERQGITDEDLVRLEAGQDPKGLTPALQRILATRERLAEAISASPAGRRRTQLGIFQEAEEGL